jgi:hypothetical protein
MQILEGHTEMTFTFNNLLMNAAPERNTITNGAPFEQAWLKKGEHPNQKQHSASFIITRLILNYLARKCSSRKGTTETAHHVATHGSQRARNRWGSCYVRDQVLLVER